MGIQFVTEPLHVRLCRSTEVGIGYGVETYEVHAATHPREQFAESLGMCGGIVDTAEDCVLEGEATLPGPIVGAEEADNIRHRVGLFGRHELQAFVGHWRVQADSNVHVGLFDEAPKLRHDPDGRERDSSRAPSVAPIGGEDTNAFYYVVSIVGRLSHAHVDNVRKLVVFID